MAPTKIEAAEISQAFSTGAVESMITSPTTGKNKKIWENGVAYFYDIAAWFPKNMVIVNKDAWNKLDAATQKLVMSEAAKAEKKGWDLSKKGNKNDKKVLEETLIFVQIIFIDIVMAADNAIIIGMVAANFAPKNRKQIIMWGVFAAFVFRVIFAFSATFLFQFAFIKLIGGVLLLWIVNELRQDLFTIQKIKSPTKKSKEPSFMSGVYKVLIADITLSFDNVLGVAGAAKEHYLLLLFGLALSVVLIGAAASYFAKYIQDNKWVGYVGLAVILLVAVQLIIGGLIGYGVLTINEPFASWF